MVDFLASFNFGAETAAPATTSTCASVDELKQQLQDLTSAKVTETRAEHVTTTLELGAAALVSLNLSESENQAMEHLASESAGGRRFVGAGIAQSNGTFLRTLNVSDCLFDQPHDDPVLQKHVGKHIVEALGAVDQSAWAVREMTRTSQGWYFVYACKDSHQMWKRQRPKGSKSVIGEYSLKEPDADLMGRPAFDCRGTVTVTFSRNGRSISITYNHTPIHRTVGQLAALYKPPPRQLGPGAQKPKTPKKSASERKKGEESSRARDPNGSTRKRKKRNNGEAQPTGGDGDGDAPGEVDDGMPHAATEASAAPGIAQPSAQSTEASQPNGTQARQASSGPPGLGLLLNLSPAEIARRREVAIVMLTAAGVDPKTLSAEQLSIFSNQSPELQKDSLNMLVKYGAERLRIVQPSHETPASTSSTPTQNSPAAPTAPATTTQELVPQAQESTPEVAGKRKRKRTSKAAEAAAAASASKARETPTATPTQTKRARKGAGKSRVACLRCKSNAIKCPHEKPTCAECESAGATCEYPPPKPKNPKQPAKSAATVQAEEESELEEAMLLADDTQQPMPQQVEPQVEQEHTPEMQEYIAQSQMPVSEMLTSSLPASVPLAMNQSVQSTYFQSADGLALPRAEPPVMQYPPPPTVQPHVTTIDRGYGSSMDQGLAPSHQPVQAQAQADRDTTSQRTKSGRRTLVNSPRRTVNSPSLPPATQQHQQQQSHRAAAASRNLSQSPTYSIAEVARAKSRQGHRSQTQTPQASQSNRNSYQPMPPSQPANHGHALRNSASSSTAAATTTTTTTSTNYNSQSAYTRQSTTSDSQEQSRIPYEPYAQQRSSRDVSYQNHNYNNRNSRASDSYLMSGRQKTTATKGPASSTASTHGSQWTSLQNRGVHSQSHGNVYSGDFNGTMPSLHATSTAAVNMHGSSQPTQSDHTGLDRDQSHSQPHSQAPVQQPVQQPVSQNQWYDYNTLTSETFGNQSHERATYGWKYPSNWSGTS
ncbi:hypothetical protein B0I35DRAFT_4749 [Stachybotrys elegans]|uniref:Zn(2)-C6 fungal-type domain-containing protein n=1 Tax=Stachybotrys elegans TaxID=80388 RepID=A0A8K0WXL1_9HYPO|nr:hypothetical protein B0I35DRAFT_4749 [Stachybotrys elegans]